MNSLLGPIQKTEDKQQKFTSTDSVESKRAPSKQRRGSIAKGRTIVTTEDDTRGATSTAEEPPDSLGVGCLTGARVHLPIITEDEDGNDVTVDQPQQNALTDKRLVLPSLFAGASLRNRRHSSTVQVQLEVAGQDLQLPPSKGGLPDQSRRHSWQDNKTKQLPVVLSPNWLETEFVDDIIPEIIPEEPLRHVLQCHSIGIPMKITRQDYRPGRYATPLFHCQRCLNSFEKLGRVPKECSEPNKMVSGKEMLLSDQAFNYIKDIWGKHLAVRLKKKSTGESDQLITEEIQNLLLKSEDKKASGHTSPEESDSEYTSFTDRSEDSDVSRCSDHRKKVATHYEAGVSVKHKRRRRRRKGSIHNVSHERVTSQSSHKIKKTKRHKRHERHKRNNKQGEEGDDNIDLTVSEDEVLDGEDSHPNTKSGSRKSYKWRKKEKRQRATTRRKRYGDEEEGNGVYSNTDDSIDGEDSHHQDLPHSQRDQKRDERRKRRNPKTGKKGRRTKHGTIFKTWVDHIIYLRRANKGYHRKRRAKRHERKCHGEYQGGEEEEDSDTKSPGGEDSHEILGSSRGSRKKHHKKKRRHSRVLSRDKKDHGKEEDGSGSLTDEHSSETSDDKTRSVGRRASKGHSNKGRKKRADRKGQREDYDGEEEEEYSHHEILSSSHDSRKKHHMKKRQHSKHHIRSKRDPENGDDSDSDTVSEEETSSEDSYHDIGGRSRNARHTKTKNKQHSKGHRKEKRVGYDEEEDESEAYTVSEDEMLSSVDRGRHDSHRESKRGHKKKKRHSKRGKKGKKKEHDNHAVDGSDSGVFLLPGRYEENELEAGSSYDELISRLIDDYESQNLDMHQNLTQQGSNQPPQYTREHGRSHPGQTRGQYREYNQESISRFSTDGLTDRSSAVYTPESYNRHARRQSQGSHAVIKSFSDLPPQDGERSRRESLQKENKPVIKNTMVKNKTGKPGTQRGHLKGNIRGKVASSSDGTRNLKTAPEQSSSSAYVIADTSQSSAQLSRRRSSVNRAGRRINQSSSIQVIDSPSEQVFDETMASQTTISDGLPQRTVDRTRKMSQVPTGNRVRRVSDLAHNSRQIDMAGPTDDRRGSQVQRTTSNILSSWATSNTDLPNFRFNTGSRPPSSVGSQVPPLSQMIDGVPNPNDANLPTKMGVPPLPTLPNRTGLESRRETKSKPVAEVKPSVTGKKGTRSPESEASSLSSPASSRESFEDSFEELERLSKRRNAMILPDFGGLSALSFTPAFTFSFYPRLVVHQETAPRSSDAPVGKKPTKKIPATKGPPKFNAGMTKENARKPKTDINKMAKKMQHKVANPKPIAKFVKKPPPEKKKPEKKKHTRRSTHKVSSPYQSVTKVYSRSTGKIRKHDKSNVNIKPSLISDSGLRLQPSRLSLTTVSPHQSKTSTIKVSSSPQTSKHSATVEHAPTPSTYNIEIDPAKLLECESVLIQVTDYM